MTQELSLVRRCQAGDRRACNDLLVANDAFIRGRALRFRAGLCDPDDLVQEARLGFLRAIEKFDAGAGASLVTYADRWIRHRLSRWSKYYDAEIRVPVAVQRAVHGGQRGEFFETAALAMRQAARLDAPMDEHEGGRNTLGDVIGNGDETADGRLVDADVARHSRELLRALLAILNPKQRRAMELRYLSDPPLLEEEIAAAMGLSSARVWQILRMATERLKRRVAGARADDFDDLLDLSPDIFAWPISPAKSGPRFDRCGA